MKSFSTRSPLLRVCACWLTILAALTSQSSIQAGDLSVTGDLGVSGVLDVNGNAFNFGSWADNPGSFGLGMTYAEDASHASIVTLTTTRSSSGWSWQQAAPTSGTGSVPKMRLSTGNALTLYDQSTPTPNAKIVLDPVGTSSFGTSTVFNGANNLMPNQNLSGGADSILTVGLADARYPVHYSVANGASIALGSNTTANGIAATALGVSATADGYGGTSIGQNSHAGGSSATALGSGANASGFFSMSMGSSSTSTGYGSVAIGINSHATNDYAAALGVVSSASGYGSNALGYSSAASGEGSVSLGAWSAATSPSAESLGYHSSASGSGSVALGSFSNASGYYSTALTSSSVASGDYAVSAGLTNASSLCTFAVGAYGIVIGDQGAWNDTDELFVVGNGLDIDDPSNAFVVRKNGDTEVWGKLDVAGKLTVTGPVIVQPQGDLSMGEFTAQPSPTP